MSKNHRGHPATRTVMHELHCWEIDEQDEVDDGGQCCLVWCATCGRYEGWFLPDVVIGKDVVRTVRGPAQWKGYRA